MLRCLSCPLSRRGGRNGAAFAGVASVEENGTSVPLLPLPARLASGSGNPLRQGRSLPAPGWGAGRARTQDTFGRRDARLSTGGSRAFSFRSRAASLAPVHPADSSCAVVNPAWARPPRSPRRLGAPCGSPPLPAGRCVSPTSANQPAITSTRMTSLDFLRSPSGSRRPVRPGRARPEAEASSWDPQEGGVKRRLTALLPLRSATLAALAVARVARRSVPCSPEGASRRRAALDGVFDRPRGEGGCL